MRKLNYLVDIISNESTAFNCFLLFQMQAVSWVLLVEKRAATMGLRNTTKHWSTTLLLYPMIPRIRDTATRRCLTHRTRNTDALNFARLINSTTKQFNTKIVQLYLSLFQKEHFTICFNVWTNFKEVNMSLV